MTAKEKVQSDADSIYIGNIYTIEEDLQLPKIGKNGTAITWASDMPHLISTDGSVTRPRIGTGNRNVALTATVELDGESVVRVFNATVLALKSNVKIIEALTVRASIPNGCAYTLPGVVIVKKDDDTFSTSTADWKNVPDFALLKDGEHEITGEPLPETDIVPKAVITVKTGHILPVEAATSAVVKKCDYGDVKITGGFLNENRIRAEEFLISCDPDTLLYNFRDAAGLDTKNAPPMQGWDAPECLLKGHTTGHYLSAIALAYAGKTENRAKLGDMITTMIDGLEECQQAMEKSGKFNYGFLSGYSEEQFDKLEEYVVYPKIWAPYYTLHKILSGLIDCHEYAGSEKALEIAAKIGLWTYNRLSKLPAKQLNKMWEMYIAGEYGGMNESLARLYKYTGDSKHLIAAKLFDNEKLFYPMSENVDTLGGIHGNQHVPQICGALEIYAQTNEKPYYDIARNFWHFVTSAHIYNIGGSGEGEMFQDPHKIGTKLSEKTAESCVSYNMLKLTGMLFEYEPKSCYMDYFEKTLLNHIAASQDQSGAVGGSTYFMPLLPGAKKSYDSRSNTCCHGTGLENHVKYQDALYYLRGNTVYVNLYVPSELTLEGTGSLSITGDYLRKSGGHRAFITITRKGFDELRLRIPRWSRDGLAVMYNGKAAKYEEIDGYAVISGEFDAGDEIEAAFGFGLRVERTVDAPEIASLYYGPLVLVALDESDEFLVFEEGFEGKLQQDGDFEFSLDGRKFVPNYFAATEKYHAYFKSRQP